MLRLVLHETGAVSDRRLIAEDADDLPEPASGELLLRVLACGVCRTDLHLVEGELDADVDDGQRRVSQQKGPAAGQAVHVHLLLGDAPDALLRRPDVAQGGGERSLN